MHAVQSQRLEILFFRAVLPIRAKPWGKIRVQGFICVGQLLRKLRFETAIYMVAFVCVSHCGYVVDRLKLLILSVSTKSPRP